MNMIRKTAIVVLWSSVFSFNLQAEPLYPLPIPDTGPMSSVAVTPANASLIVGETKQYQVSGTFMDLSTRDLSAGASRIATPAINSTSLFGSATLLDDGKVLLAGVHQNDTSLSLPSFLYDPATNTFAETSTMQEPRSYFVATLLKTRKVLFVGSYGYGPSDFSGTAELYDPDTGTFSYTSSTQIARSSPTATLLDSGKVLVTGGWVGEMAGVITSAAEVYDPTTGTFSLTGPMSIRRAWHTATRLLNGDVLVIGGNAVNLKTNTAEIYDHVTGQFRRTNNDMAASRQNHAATLLANGKVFITGGSVAEDEIYDPVTATFSKTGTISPLRSEGAKATLLGNGKVFLTGKNLVEDMIYDPATNVLSSTGIANANATAFSVGAPLLKNGKVFALTVKIEFPMGLLFTDIFTPAEDITWSSSRPSVATINQTGLASGVSYSTSSTTPSIAASLGTISGSTSLKVYSKSPTVVTNSVANVQQTTATLNGTVNTNGDTGGVWGVCAPASGNFGSVILTSPFNGQLSLNMTGLESNTNYTCHMNAWVNHTNQPDTVGTPDITFKTLTYPAPVATTGVATQIKATSATLNGTCNLQGGSGSAWFTYWKTAKPSTVITTTSQPLLASSSLVAVSQSISGLSKGVTAYTFTLTCENNGGKDIGVQSAFQTLNR
ncbi:MAG: hypothetical protein Q7S51_02225 [Gallionellaceae bacterium]|nr:hypothetical protein [Gallionellaceae bacterium]